MAEKIEKIQEDIKNLYILINRLNKRIDLIHEKFDPNERLKGVSPYPMGDEG